MIDHSKARKVFGLPILGTVKLVPEIPEDATIIYRDFDSVFYTTPHLQPVPELGSWPIATAGEIQGRKLYHIDIETDPFNKPGKPK